MLRTLLPCLAAALLLGAPALARVSLDAPDAAAGTLALGSSPHTYVGFVPERIDVVTGPGVLSADPNDGAGTLACHGAEGHHSAYGTVTVHDLVFGATVEFTVSVDTHDASGLGAGCGDFEADQSVDCIGTCTLPIGPGLDGTYRVSVTGATGSIHWP